MSLKARFPEALEIPSLAPEIVFLTRDSFYYGPDKPADQADFERLVEKLDWLDIPRASPSGVRTVEILGHEAALAAYYRRIIELTSRYRLSFLSVRHYFWLRLQLCNPQCEIKISFPWYDSFYGIEGFLAAIAEINSGLVYDDEDQGWGLEVHALEGLVYVRQWEPESQQTLYEIIVPRDQLVAEVTGLRRRARHIISYLAKELGTDFWTSYAHEQTMLRFKRPWWRFW